MHHNQLTCTVSSKSWIASRTKPCISTNRKAHIIRDILMSNFTIYLANTEALLQHVYKWSSYIVRREIHQKQEVHYRNRVAGIIFLSSRYIIRYVILQCVVLSLIRFSICQSFASVRLIPVEHFQRPAMGPIGRCGRLRIGAQPSRHRNRLHVASAARHTQPSQPPSGMIE